MQLKGRIEAAKRFAEETVSLGWTLQTADDKLISLFFHEQRAKQQRARERRARQRMRLREETESSPEEERIYTSSEQANEFPSPRMLLLQKSGVKRTRKLTLCSMIEVEPCDSSEANCNLEGPVIFGSDCAVQPFPGDHGEKAVELTSVDEEFINDESNLE